MILKMYIQREGVLLCVTQTEGEVEKQPCSWKGSHESESSFARTREKVLWT